MIAIDSPRAWGALLVAVWVTASVARTPPPQARPWPIRELPAIPGAVVVVDAGDADRVLRYPVRGRTELDAQVSVGQDVALARCTVEGAARDAFSLVCTVELAGADGMRVGGVFDDRGRVRRAWVSASPDVPRAIVAGIADALLRIEPLPDEAVGAGARWEETRLIGEPATARTRRVELTSAVGSRLALRTTITDTGGATGLEVRALDPATFADRLRTSIDGSTVQRTFSSSSAGSALP